MLTRRMSALAALSFFTAPRSTFAQSEVVQDIPIGSLYALTGPAAPSNLGDAYAVRLAVKEIEDAGGFDVAGKRYRFVLEEQDTSSRPQAAIAAVQKLIGAGAKFIFGPTTTVDWVPAWAIMAKAGVMNFSFATGALPYLGTPDARYLFYPNAGLQAPIDAAVDVAAKLWNFKTAAILIPGDAVGQVALPYFKAALSRHGAELLFDSSFSPASREFSSQLTRIKAAQPDVIIGGYFDDMMSALMRQAVELGAGKKFIGMRGVTELAGLPLGNRIDGLVFPLVGSDPSDPAIEGFVASFKKHFGKDPDRQMTAGVYIHDAVWMLAAGMSAAGTVTDLAKISTALEHLASYPHSIMNLRFTGDHKAQHGQVVGHLDGKTGKVAFEHWAA